MRNTWMGFQECDFKSIEPGPWEGNTPAPRADGHHLPAGACRGVFGGGRKQYLPISHSLGIIMHPLNSLYWYIT